MERTILKVVYFGAVVAVCFCAEPRYKNARIRDTPVKMAVADTTTTTTAMEEVAAAATTTTSGEFEGETEGETKMPLIKNWAANKTAAVDRGGKARLPITNSAMRRESAEGKGGGKSSSSLEVIATEGYGFDDGEIDRRSSFSNYEPPSSALVAGKRPTGFTLATSPEETLRKKWKRRPSTPEPGKGEVATKNELLKKPPLKATQRRPEAGGGQGEERWPERTMGVWSPPMAVNSEDGSVVVFPETQSERTVISSSQQEGQSDWYGIRAPTFERKKATLRPSSSASRPAAANATFKPSTTTSKFSAAASSKLWTTQKVAAHRLNSEEAYPTESVAWALAAMKSHNNRIKRPFQEGKATTVPLVESSTTTTTMRPATAVYQTTMKPFVNWSTRLFKTTTETKQPEVTTTAAWEEDETESVAAVKSKIARNDNETISENVVTEAAAATPESTTLVGVTTTTTRTTAAYDDGKAGNISVNSAWDGGKIDSNDVDYSKKPDFATTFGVKSTTAAAAVKVVVESVTKNGSINSTLVPEVHEGWITDLAVWNGTDDRDLYYDKSTRYPTYDDYSSSYEMNDTYEDNNNNNKYGNYQDFNDTGIEKYIADITEIYEEYNDKRKPNREVSTNGGSGWNATTTATMTAARNPWKVEELADFGDGKKNSDEWRNYLDSRNVSHGMRNSTEQNHNSTDQNHNSTDQGHNSTDQDRYSLDRSHNLTDRGHSLMDRGHNSTDRIQNLSDLNHNSMDRNYNSMDQNQNHNLMNSMEQSTDRSSNSLDPTTGRNENSTDRVQNPMDPTTGRNENSTDRVQNPMDQTMDRNADVKGYSMDRNMDQNGYPMDGNTNEMSHSMDQATTNNMDQSTEQIKFTVNHNYTDQNNDQIGYSTDHAWKDHVGITVNTNMTNQVEKSTHQTSNVTNLANNSTELMDKIGNFVERIENSTDRFEISSDGNNSKVGMMENATDRVEVSTDEMETFTDQTLNDAMSKMETWGEKEAGILISSTTSKMEGDNNKTEDDVAAIDDGNVETEREENRKLEEERKSAVVSFGSGENVYDNSSASSSSSTTIAPSSTTPPSTSAVPPFSNGHRTQYTERPTDAVTELTSTIEYSYGKSSTTTTAAFPATSDILDAEEEDASTTEPPFGLDGENQGGMMLDVVAKPPGNIPGYLMLVFRSSFADICSDIPFLKQSLYDFIANRSRRVQSKDQVIMIVNPNQCRDADHYVTLVPVTVYILDESGAYDGTLVTEFKNLLQAHEFNYSSPIYKIVYHEEPIPDNRRVIVAFVITSIAAVSLIVLAFLTFTIRSRQTMMTGKCDPVSLDDYSIDNMSIYNSVRGNRKSRASKRSYGNHAFDDATGPSKRLNFSGLVKASDSRNALDEEFADIPTISVRPEELPAGAEVKNRYANVLPLPETRVSLSSRCTESVHDYINANYVKGYKGEDKFYIACQAPLQSTIDDFWKMVWKEQTKVIIMLTALKENEVEKCADYLPPSEVSDCHRLFGEYQVTLKKREVKEKYVISSLQLKSMESNLWREVTHLWYLNWPSCGVPSEQSSIIALLIEARSYMRNSPGPHVVHCSPGDGRTGTVIACDICIRDYEQTRSVNVPETVGKLRRCRAGAVKTKDQYAFIYKVLALYAKKLSSGTPMDSI